MTAHTQLPIPLSPLPTLDDLSGDDNNCASWWYQRAAAFCLLYAAQGDVNEREHKFLRQVTGLTTRPSDKQRDWLLQLAARIREARLRQMRP